MDAAERPRSRGQGRRLTEAFHVLCGVPRSGLTLLANVLRQNPSVYASSTSHVPAALAMVSKVWTESPEVKSDAIGDWKHTQERGRAALRGYVDGWYSRHSGKVVIDNAKPWSHHLRLLQWLYPEAMMLVCVRDLVEVVASIEKQHAQSAMFDRATSPQAKTLEARAQMMLAPDGPVGVAVNGVMDLVRRAPESVYVVKYNDLARQPKTTLFAIYEHLGLPFYEHDFENVENTAEDVDGVYLHKFPHEGCGEVSQRLPDTGAWVSEDVATWINATFNSYQGMFGNG